MSTNNIKYPIDALNAIAKAIDESAEDSKYPVEALNKIAKELDSTNINFKYPVDALAEIARDLPNAISGGGGGGDTQLPCLYCEIRNLADNISGFEYVDGSFVDGIIKSVMVVKNVSTGAVIILPTVRGSDRDGNVYVIAGLGSVDIEENEATVPGSSGLCVKYRWEEHYGPNDEYSTEEIFEGVYSGIFKAWLEAASQKTVDAGTKIFGMQVRGSDGSFTVDGDESTELGFYVNYDTNSWTWPTNGFVQVHGFVSNFASSAMAALWVSDISVYSGDGMITLSVICDPTDQTIIPNSERVAYFQPSRFALGVYRPPVSDNGTD